MDSQRGGLRSNLGWYRVVVVAALIASVWITWPLWNPRAQPPPLPVLELPQVPLAWPIVVASLAALVTPRAGAIVATGLIACGMASDQTRMQPEFFSLPLLLWGTLPFEGARLVARAHLISLWFFAGFHKLMSPEYFADGGPRLLRGLPLALPEDIIPLAVFSFAVLETGTALLAVAPSTRRLAAWSALALHAGILVAFFPLADTRNAAVWPWNVALAVSGFALIAPWRTGVRAALRGSSLAARASTLEIGRAHV
jgi:hypothetical protein